jgi:hypothetical protein
MKRPKGNCLTHVKAHAKCDHLQVLVLGKSKVQKPLLVWLVSHQSLQVLDIRN